MKFITCLLLGLVITSFSVLADTGCTESECSGNDLTVASGFAAAGDLILVRPLGAAATVGSFGIFAVVSPFAAMADSTEVVYSTLVEKPGKFTFDRDLGDFSK
jgi:hypothetical protein